MKRAFLNMKDVEEEEGNRVSIFRPTTAHKFGIHQLCKLQTLTTFQADFERLG